MCCGTQQKRSVIPADSKSLVHSTMCTNPPPRNAATARFFVPLVVLKYQTHAAFRIRTPTQLFLPQTCRNLSLGISHHLGPFQIHALPRRSLCSSFCLCWLTRGWHHAPNCCTTIAQRLKGGTPPRDSTPAAETRPRRGPSERNGSCSCPHRLAGTPTVETRRPF